MSAAAILLVGTSLPGYRLAGWEKNPHAASAETLGGVPIACAEILGCSLIYRTLEYFAQGGITSFAVLVDDGVLRTVGQTLVNPQPAWSVQMVPFSSESEVWPAIERTIGNYFANHFDHVFLLWSDAYVELDLDDVLQFSRDNQHSPVHIHDRLGPLGIWLLSSQWQTNQLRSARHETSFKTYFCNDYVNRFSRVRDIRRFAQDLFVSRCAARPCGNEIRPGIWVNEGAQLHRQARVVPPAYIGKNTKVGAAALVTRASSIERDCNVDYGTVIEDSSILAGTYIGIGLDVAHSVVSGSHLVHLHQNLAMEIQDEVLIGINRPTRLAETFRRRTQMIPHTLSTKVQRVHSKGVL